MADQLYNFSDYYQTTTAEAEIKIDMSGIPLKAQAASADSDGAEVALNEAVTNNVCYYIAEIDYTTGTGETGVLNTAQFGDKNNGRRLVKITKTSYTIDDDGALQASDPENVYIRVGYSYDRLLEAELILPDDTKLTRLADDIVADAGSPNATSADELKDTIEIKLYEQPDSDDDAFNKCLGVLSKVTVKYVPRYAMMAGPDDDPKDQFYYINDDDDAYNSYPQSQNFEFQQNSWSVLKASLAALGFFGKREMTYKWLSRNISKNTAAVWNYDKLQKTLKFIENYIGDANYGFNITYYDTNYWDNSKMEDSDGNAIEDATRSDYRKNRSAALKKHAKYLARVKAANYALTDMTNSTKYDELSTNLQKFLSNSTIKAKGDIDYINGLQEVNGTGSALIPNVCDAFKAFFIPSETLESDFNEAFYNVLNGLYELPFTNAILKKMSSKNRKRIIALRNSMLTKKQDDTPDYMLDLNEFYYSLYQVYHDNHDGKAGDDVFGMVHSRYLPEYGSSVYVAGSWGLRATVAHYQMLGKNSVQTKSNSNVNSKGWPIPPTSGNYGNKAYFSAMNYFYKACFDNGSTKFADYGDLTAEQLVNDYVIDSIEYSSDEIVAQLTSWFNVWFHEMVDSKKLFSNYEWFVDTDNASPAGDAGGFVVGIKKIDEDEDGTAYDFYLDKRWTFLPKDENGEDRYACLPVDNFVSGAESSYSNLDDAAKTDIGGVVITGDAIFSQLCTLAQYLDQCAMVVQRLVSKKTGYYDLIPNHGIDVKFPDTINVIKWDTYVWADSENEKPSKSSPKQVPDYNRMMPAYKSTFEIGDGDFNMDFIIDKVIGSAMPEAIAIARAYVNRFDFDDLDENQRKLIEQVDDLRTELSKFNDIIDNIKYYQFFTNESVFTNLGIIQNFTAPYDFKKVPARFMVPVHMYKKVRKKYKRWGRTRHRMVKESIGVRWADIRIIDGNILSSYPQVDEGSYKEVLLQTNATFNTYNSYDEFHFENSSDAFDDAGITENTEGVLVVGHIDDRKNPPDMINVTYISSNEFRCTDETVRSQISDFYKDGESYYVYSFRTSLDATKDNGERHPVQIVYDMPYLPYPDEIRTKSFIDYGPFDQSKFAVKSRSGADYKGYTNADGEFVYERDADGNLIPLNSEIDGWQVFHDTSKRIKDMRDGLGIHHAVAMLMAILKNEFGEQRVLLSETMRSKSDEALQCTGSDESEFLSWHNYGLAVKILILQEDLHSTIEQDSEDMWKLIDIAEAFTEACRTAKVCPQPLNVVWCGRLVMGANNFVWEFLPIGVNHKDALKFRDAILAQRDPVAEYGYVDVDTAGYVLNKKPDSGYTKPYVLSSSNVYTDATIINGKHYVSPDNIINYSRPRNLPMINIIEYIKLIELKMQANGTTLTDRANIYDWKALSDESFNQLITFFGLIGNFGAVHTLLGGDYVETYQNTVDMWFSSSHVDFVKEFLGDAYYNVKIFIKDTGNGGAYIMLHDGKLHIKVSEMQSKYDTHYDKNFFGAKQTDINMLERGEYIKGVFFSDAELEAMGETTEFVTDEPVVDGYKMDSSGNITVEGGDALLLHSLITTQLKNTYDDLKEKFENYQGKLLYDRFVDGPNFEMYDMLENEFGLIAAQDLTSFDRLRTMLTKNSINDSSSLSSSYGGSGNGSGTSGSGNGGANAGANEEDGGFLQSDGNGNRYDSIYEKVVSNAQLSGVRKASLTKEHVEQTVKPGSLNVERMYKLISQGRKITANDLLG